jgi:hypothetical protein
MRMELWYRTNQLLVWLIEEDGVVGLEGYISLRCFRLGALKLPIQLEKLRNIQASCIRASRLLWGDMWRSGGGRRCRGTSAGRLEVWS